MATLTGQTIASSYEQLLHVDTDGGGNGTTLVPVKDGDNGTTFAMQLSTTTICIDNPTASAADQGGILRLQSDDGAVMASGHRLGVIEFAGAEDTSNTITVGARIEALADATWSASENGADLLFYTTDGNASQSEKMRINANGYLGVGVTATQPFHVANSFDGDFVSLLHNTDADNGQGLMIRAGADSGEAILSLRTQDSTELFKFRADGNFQATGNVNIVQTTTTATSTPKALFIDANLSGDAAQDSTGLHLDFDRTVAGSGTAAHNDIGINLDVNSASLGTSSLVGMDIDVTGASSGTSTATGINVNVTGADTNYAAVFTGGNVGIGNLPDNTGTLADPKLHIKSTGTNEDSQVLVETSGGGDAEAICRVKNANGTWDIGYMFHNSGDIEIGRRRGGSGKASFGPGKELVLDSNSRISLSNNDSSGGTTNTIFGYLAGEDLASGGNYNTFLGHNAGHENKLGDQNIAIGYQAMDASYIDDTQDDASINNLFIGNNSGGGTWVTAASHSNVGVGNNVMTGAMNGANNNTGVGLNSLVDITTGYRNTGTGAWSLYEATTGHSNVAVGYASQQNSTSGLYNTAVGSDSLYANVQGDNNTSIGFASLYYFTAGSDGHGSNTAVGSEASRYLDTGQFNTMIGAKAGESEAGTITYAENTGVGYKALFALTTGDGNLAIGAYSGDAITTGGENTLVGHSSGGNFDTNAGNTALGYEALSGAGDASYCVALGKESLKGALTSAANGSVAVGSNALVANTSGAGNIGIGYQAGLAIVDSSNNTAIGYQSMVKLVRLDARNVAIGNYSMDNHTENAYNVAIGYNALTAMSAGNTGSIKATYNTAVGYQAGDALVGGYSSGGGDPADEGMHNTFIGAETDASATGGNNQNVVGYGTTGQADNSITLGNASVTAVYMAQDKGAKIYAGDAQFAAPDNTGHLIVDLWADRGDDNADKWRIEIEDGADFTIESFTSGSWVEKLAIANDGTFTGSSSNDISDERLKENIKNITGGLDAINKLQGRTFNWKKSADMNTRTNYGLIAQEVEKVIPELIYEKGGIRELTPEVLYSEKDTIPSDKKIGDVKEKATYYKSLNTSGLVPVLIEAVKELSAKVTELESKLK